MHKRKKCVCVRGNTIKQTCIELRMKMELKSKLWERDRERKSIKVVRVRGNYDRKLHVDWNGMQRNFATLKVNPNKGIFARKNEWTHKAFRIHANNLFFSVARKFIRSFERKKSK